MFSFIYENFKKGILKVSNNPQLIYTVAIAILIVGSFLYMSGRFISIANDAQERLVNVRSGSLQDVFVSFAKDKIDDPTYLNKKIEDIVSTNETIKTFEVVVKKNIADPTTGVATNSFEIIASNNKADIGGRDDQAPFLFSLASGDPTHSITLAVVDQNERLFRTTRAITDQMGNTVGAVITVQTLSMADMAVEKSIQNSRILFLFILVLVMFLFLRHSKIIDYVDLYKKLKGIDEMKDNFISMASHELRTPLSIIRGYAEFVQEAPELSQKTKEYVSKIDVSTKELDFLVTDILDVSRIEQGRMSFELEKINPNKVLEEIAASFVLPAKEKNLSLTIDTSKVENTILINIDMGRFKQTLINLIGNAVKYTLKGEVNVAEYIEKERLFIKVSDTGLGMSEEEKNKLFEKFYRIRNKETENIRGTGLGLWITKGIIEQMGGTISVESIKGVGSHFIISFPVIH
jgi:signal transduction histidine kinase